MSCIKKKIRHICSQLPRGGCGLKSCVWPLLLFQVPSASARGLWIEIIGTAIATYFVVVSFREGAVDWNTNDELKLLWSNVSASARGLWIEIHWQSPILVIYYVSFREGAVDWNQLISECYPNYKASASARGLRIEILEIKISMRNSDRQLPQGSCGDRNPL